MIAQKTSDRPLLIEDESIEKNERESAKERKREIEADESSGRALPHALVRSVRIDVLPSFAFSPFRVFAMSFPRGSHDVRDEGI